MIHLYVGNGRGKTTAVTGLALRLLENKERVLLVSFLKNDKSGEIQWLKKNSPIKIICQNNLKKFVKDMTPTEYEVTKTAQLKLLGEALNDCALYDVIILDEFTDIIDLGMIETAEAIDIVKRIAKKAELIITGHYLVEDLVELSDYYTEFISHKHPYTKGIKARKGIEY